jgi:cytochrome c551/c552
MNKFYGLLILLSTTLFSHCGPVASEEEITENTELLSDDEVKGIYLLSAKCFSCHSPESSTIAPEFASIRTAYIQEFEEKEAFISHMLTFLQQPTNENAQMKEAVKQYGLMPKLLFTDQELQYMLNYLYERGTSTEQILADYTALSSLPSPVFETDYLSKGMEIAMATKSALGKQLMQAIQEKGTEQAVAFCNTVALPLTDSVAKVWNATVKRVSDQPRNPKNTAQPEELAIIATFKTALQHGEPIKPIVVFPPSGKAKAIGYYPIETNAMCLQCHGLPQTNITTTVYNRIKQLYPNDKATGYGEQELRGIFVVEMFD